MTYHLRRLDGREVTCYLPACVLEHLRDGQHELVAGDVEALVALARAQAEHLRVALDCEVRA